MRTIGSLLTALWQKYKGLGGIVKMIGLNCIVVDRAVFRSTPAKNIRNRWQVLDWRENLVGMVRNFRSAVKLAESI